jgi:hypothetical protein
MGGARGLPAKSRRAGSVALPPDARGTIRATAETDGGEGASAVAAACQLQIGHAACSPDAVKRASIAAWPPRRDGTTTTARAPQPSCRCGNALRIHSARYGSNAQNACCLIHRCRTGGLYHCAAHHTYPPPWRARRQPYHDAPQGTFLPRALSAGAPGGGAPGKRDTPPPGSRHSRRTGHRRRPLTIPTARAVVLLKGHTFPAAR